MPWAPWGTRADSHDGPAQVDGCAAPVHGVVQDAEGEHGHSGLLEDPEVVTCKQGGQEGGSQPGCPVQREVCRPLGGSPGAVPPPAFVSVPLHVLSPLLGDSPHSPDTSPPLPSPRLMALPVDLPFTCPPLSKAGLPLLTISAPPPPPPLAGPPRPGLPAWRSALPPQPAQSFSQGRVWRSERQGTTDPVSSAVWPGPAWAWPSGSSAAHQGPLVPVSLALQAHVGLEE